MTATRRLPQALRAAALSALAAAALLAAASSAQAAFTKESLSGFEHQLASGQIHSATFNKRVRSLHLTLKDGTLYLVHYGAGEQKKLQEKLEARGIPVTIEKPEAALKEAKAKPVHHKLRYIIGGVLLGVVVVVGIVLFIDRRRKAAAERI